MAKKLVLGYEIDANNNAVIVPGNVFPEKIQLITDVETGTILYNFADATKGYTTVEFEPALEKTFIYLDQDISSYASNTATFQIFIDEPQETNVSDELLDPVNKIRVSNPENLIDTDFEYGLQSTKWETLELAGNIPSFYASGTDGGLRGINRITSVQNSDQVTVLLDEPHGLTAGNPILVQGLTQVTGEGKYLIATVIDDFTFTYKAKGVLNTTGKISGPYTTIDPGQFYVGSQIDYRTDIGITTDQAANSTLTVTTENSHGFQVGSQLYLTNTISPKKFSLTANLESNAPDGRPYVDIANTVSTTLTANTTFTETKQMRGMYYKKITADNVDVANDRILWEGHEFKNSDAVFYCPPNGDSPIGGLEAFQIYHVRDVVAGVSFKLCETDGNTTVPTPSAAIPFTSAGTYNYGRGQFMIAYKLDYIYSGSYQYYTRFYTRGQNRGGTGSGWDLYDTTKVTSDGYMGLMGARPDYTVFVTKNPGNWNNIYHYSVLYYPWDQTGYMNSTNHRLGGSYGYDASTGLATDHNFVEDITRYSGYSYNWEDGYKNNHQWQRNYFHMYYAGVRRSGTRTYNAYDRQQYFIPLAFDEEADSLYFPDASFSTGDTVTLPAGSDLKYPNWTATQNYTSNYTEAAITSGGTFDVEALTEQRIKITHNGGHNRISSAKVTSPYNISGIFTNPTKHSFYLPEHGINTGDVATISTSGAGVIPSSAAGTKEYPTSSADITQMSDLIKEKMQDYVDNTLTSHQVIQQDGSAGWYPIREGATSTTNFSSNGFRFYNGYVDMAVGGAASFNQQFNDSGLFSGQVEDTFQYQSNFLKGAGFQSLSSFTWQQNSYVDYFGILQTIPTNMNIDYRYYKYAYRYSGQTYYTRARTNVTGNWWNQVQMTYLYWSNWYSMVVNLRFWNTDWSGGTNNSSFGTNNGNPLYMTGAGQNYIDYTFIVTARATISSTEIYTLCDDIVTNIANGFESTPMTNNQSLKFEIVNTNRVKPLSATNGSGFIFTDHGTPDLNLLLEGSGGFGILDGTYSVKSVPDKKSFELELPFEAVEKEIGFNANTNVSNTDNHIYKDTGHTLLSGTPLTYIKDASANNIGGLANGQTYYAYVYDDKYFGVTANVEASTSGDVIDIHGSEGNHKFTAAVVNGLVPAQGNVTVSGTTVTGTDDTLFKRYYKAGDEFIYIDNTTTPGSIVSSKIASITDDTEMSVVTGVQDVSDSKYMVPTTIYTKPDGSFLHRPFDGGVEITAGSSPDSQIIRQTRKYFRYQSGKGIQVSLAINFNPPRPFQKLTSSGNVITGTTNTPHGLSNNQTINITGARVSGYNGQQTVSSVPDAFTIKMGANTVLDGSVAGGFPQFNVDGWTNSAIRAGLYDEQNGMFWEYDGSTLYACRRSSTQQIPGFMSVTLGSNKVDGINTSFETQLSTGDKIVIRGMSYKVVDIESNTTMIIQPAYKGQSSDNVIGTKTVDLKVPQNDWNEDVCDGTGASGFIFDPTKIQMAYTDYSWYGAGKIRFGFKTTKGRVNYVHSFIHNNRETEAYMRSGNVPARYEIENTGPVEYIPSLFHWGTSVIMDGRFDNDKAYLFTASSSSLAFTNGQSSAVTTNADSFLTREWNRSQRTYYYYVNLSFPNTDADKFSVGTKLYDSISQLEGAEVFSAYYSGSNYIVRIFVGTGYYTPTYPVVPNGTAVSVGAPAAGGDATNILEKEIPLISIRLAPSVDNGITGDLGARDIINRMQLQLVEAGVLTSLDSEVDLIINGNLSNISYENVESPSLSNLIKHNAGDTIVGGKIIYSFRASAGSSVTQDLSQITDLGNSILGGDGVFPNGPDIITIAVRPLDASSVSATSPYTASARITWTESQA